jgi:hypothetical protein
VADRIAVFDAVSDPRKVLVMFNGGSHSIFTDRPGTGGWSLNPQVKSATKTLAMAFLQRSFDGDAEALPQWRRACQPIVARVAGPLIEDAATLAGARLGYLHGL